MQKHAALYCRLSVDDGSFGGSVSIETQKILLEQYCQSHDITSYEFALFELKIVGFTDEYKDIKLAMGAYVAVTDGEKTEYSYITSFPGITLLFSQYQ